MTTEAARAGDRSHARQAGCVFRRLALLAVLCLVVVACAGTGVPSHGRGYLVVGAPASEPAPVRGCDPAALERLQERVEIPAPPDGWSGAPQAVNVFNIFAGEVMVSHGERETCGRMHDARTRDSRFRASVGMVVVPAAGSAEPIRLAFATPLKSHWIPTIRIGAPSPVQQIDTARLLVRAACVAIALALASTALMGFLSTRDFVFLGYALLCLLAILWQAILSGLSGYPEPWLPVGDNESRWLVAFSCLGLSALLYVMWLLSQGGGLWPASRRWLLRLVGLVWVAGVMLAIALPMRWLGPFAELFDMAFRVACVAVLAVGGWALWRGRPEAVQGIASVLPFLLMAVLDATGNRFLVEYRVEAIQASITWFLVVSAYALNLRLGRLRQQRDEMQALADTDALTGLPNRRAGLRRLRQLVDHARAGGEALTIGFLDIDLFKGINDRFGHAVGDRVLVAVAQALAGSVREVADVSRMGGEEFLVLLPGVAPASARARMETMRGQVARLGAELGVPGLTVTASIGLAALGGEQDADALLRRADEAMYQAKRDGRNRVVGLPAAAGR